MQEKYALMGKNLIFPFMSVVHVGDGVPEILIDRQWLKNRRLVVDLSAGVLTLETC